MNRESHFSRRAFCRAGGSVGLSLIAPGLTRLAEIISSRDPVVQVGITEVEIAGVNYGVEVNSDAVVASALWFADRWGGEGAVAKVSNWFVHNQLVIELLPQYTVRPILMPHRGEKFGEFVPVELNRKGDGTKILLTRKSLEMLYDFQEDHESADPPYVFPHEVRHLVEYAEAPEVWVSQVRARVNLLLLGVGASAGVGGVAGRIADRRGGDGIEDGLVAGGLTFLGLATATSLAYPAHGEEYLEIPGLLRDDAVFRELTIGCITFTPLE